ncbi:hypothetical protein, partial [Novilysobacter arseniciresistens]|uniref:hypothetical protein n=1 Tax=Novilysobacter arseniciresistens TaxID=1385522 RepID=UPI000563F39F
LVLGRTGLLVDMYSSLALSYRQWHFRMTTAQTEQPGGPAIGLSAFQGLNVFSFLMLAPPHAIPGWLFVGAPFVVGACAFFIVMRIYQAHPASFRYAKLTDNIPGLREFPLVYSYLFGTFAFFVFCGYLAVNRAA